MRPVQAFCELIAEAFRVLSLVNVYDDNPDGDRCTIFGTCLQYLLHVAQPLV